MDNYIKAEKFNKILLTKYYIRKLEPNTQGIKTLLTYYLSLGCEKYPSEDEFSYFLQNNYDLSYEIQPYHIGSYEIFRFTLSGINPKLINDPKYNLDFLEDVFNEIMKPVIIDNSFDNEKLKKAKEMCICDIHYALEDIETIATNNTINYYFKNTLNDFPRISKIKDIKSIKSDDLYNYYNKLITEYNVSYMIGDIAKDINSNNIKPLESHLFIDRGKCKPIIIDKKNTNQAYLRIIYDGNIFANDDLFFPALFINEKLGGGIYSELYNIIREQLGLCYSISSSYYASSGILLISAVINKKDLDLIIKEIDKIYDSILDDFDLDFIKKQFIYDKYEELDNINTYSSNSLYNSLFPYMIPSTMEIEMINNVTMEDIKKAHKKLKKSFIYVLGGDLNE